MTLDKWLTPLKSGIDDGFHVDPSSLKLKPSKTYS